MFSTLARLQVSIAWSHQLSNRSTSFKHNSQKIAELSNIFFLVMKFDGKMLSGYNRFGLPRHTEELFKYIISLGLPMLEDEKPPEAFYADLEKTGDVELSFNRKGDLVVTQYTQFDEEMIRDPPSSIYDLAKVLFETAV